MKKIAFLFVIGLLASCKNNNTPDLSGITVHLEVKRFDQDFFSLDTTKLNEGLNGLRTKYPLFLNDYLTNILGLRSDSILRAGSREEQAVKQFLRDYKSIYDSSSRIFKNFDTYADQIREGLKYVKYYFPKYNVPSSVITFVGPMDAFFMTSFGIQGDILTGSGLGIGLQLHLGQSFPFYQSEGGQSLYPEYISRFFIPETIPVNSMKNIVDDLFPESGKSFSLVERMVNNGRRYYLLEKFIPKAKEESILSYTPEQLKGAYKNEAIVWDFFLNNDLLNSSDQDIIKNYIGQGPKTQEFGDNSPGNLGSFSGLQIVKKFVEKYPEITLDSLMRIPPREVYERSKYKPKS